MAVGLERDLKPRRTAPKEIRRQQLIDATLAVIAEKGVSGTTMSEVTGRAGLSTGIVNLHFRNKDNLLKSTLEFLARELEDRWRLAHAQTDLSAAQRLWGIIESSFHEDICTPEKIRVWFGFFGEARYRAFYREMVKNFDAARGEALEESLVELGLESDAAESLTLSIESMADGLWLSMMLYPEWLDIDESKGRIWDLLGTHFPDHFPLDASPDIASIK